jgi:hypothetical protein
MIDGILKALAGQGGAAFAKGVFDGYNEDVKAKQLQAYELAKEAAGKDPEPDTTRTLFKVTKGPLMGRVVTINNPLKDEGYGDAQSRNAEALQRIYDVTANTDGGIPWQTYDKEHGKYLKSKEGQDSLPLIRNWTEYLHQYEDIDAINQLITRTSVPANALYDISKQAASGTATSIANLPYPKQSRFWETVINQFQENAGRSIYRFKSNFIKGMSDKTKKSLDLVFLPEEGDGVGTMGVVRMNDIIKDLQILDDNNPNTFKKARAEDLYDFIYEYGKNRGFTRVANTQEQLRDMVIKNIVKMAASGQNDAGQEIGRFKVKDFLRHSMVMNQIFSDGYFNVDAGQTRLFKNYYDNVIGSEFKDNPMLMIEILGTAFTKNASPEDTQYKKDVDGFNSFVTNVLQIKNRDQFRRAMENVTKPLNRATKMIDSLQKMKQRGETFPLGGASTLGTFMAGLKRFPQMMKTVFGIDEINNFRGSETFTSTMNILDPTKPETSNLKNDHDILYNNMIEAQKQIDADPENAKKISIGQLAVMEYNTYLLAFEMAAAVQGGGDSRTISDKDVRIMQKALMLKFFTSPEAFEKVLMTVQEDLTKMRENANLYKTVLLSGNVQTAKGMGIFERARLGDNYFNSLANSYYLDAKAGYDKSNTAKDTTFNPDYNSYFRLEVGTTLKDTGRKVDETRQENFNTFMKGNENIGSIKYIVGSGTSKKAPSSFQEIINDMTRKINRYNSFQGKVQFVFGDPNDVEGKEYLKQIEKIAKLNEGVTGGTKDFIQQAFDANTAHIFYEVIRMNEDPNYIPQPRQQ